MKKLLAFALCLALLAMPLCAMAEALPISKADIDQMCNTGLTSMKQYIDALKPTEYSWYFEGEATGNTYFTLAVPGGSVTLLVHDAKDYQDDDLGLDGATELKGDVLEKEATLAGASWESDALSYVFMPRELKLGDSKEKLLASIGELEFTPMDDAIGEDAELDIEYEGDDSDPELTEEEQEEIGDPVDYDEVGSCELMVPEDPEQWHQYYGFDFFLKDGAIAMAQYWYSTDPE